MVDCIDDSEEPIWGFCACSRSHPERIAWWSAAQRGYTGTARSAAATYKTSCQATHGDKMVFGPVQRIKDRQPDVSEWRILLSLGNVKVGGSLNYSSFGGGGGGEIKVTESAVLSDSKQVHMPKRRGFPKVVGTPVETTEAHFKDEEDLARAIFDREWFLDACEHAEVDKEKEDPSQLSPEETARVLRVLDIMWAGKNEGRREEGRRAFTHGTPNEATACSSKAAHS